MSAVPEDLLDIYFTELGKVRLLNGADEVRLAKAIEAGERQPRGARAPGARGP
jgi:hypothetical protein